MAEQPPPIHLNDPMLNPDPGAIQGQGQQQQRDQCQQQQQQQQQPIVVHNQRGKDVPYADAPGMATENIISYTTPKGVKFHNKATDSFYPNKTTVRIIQNVSER
jgi:hypothetical protein